MILERGSLFGTRQYGRDLVFVFLCAFSLLSGASPKPSDIPTLKGAFARFSSDTRSYRAATTAREFSDALMATVMDFPQIQWLERSDEGLLKEELELNQAGFVDLKKSARAGHWATCDILVHGRFVTSPTSETSLILELIQPLRCELLASTNIDLGAISMVKGKSAFDELQRVSSITRVLLSAAVEGIIRHQNEIAVGLIAVFNDVQELREIRPPNVAERFADALTRTLKATEGVRPWEPTQLHQGRQEALYSQYGLFAEKGQRFGSFNSSFVVASVTNYAVLVVDGERSGWRDRYNIHVAVLNAAGDLQVLSQTNLQSLNLQNSLLEMAHQVVTVATNRSSSGTKTDPSHELANLTCEWAKSARRLQRFNLENFESRRSWLDQVGALQIAANLAWNDPNIRIEYLNTRYNPVIGFVKQGSLADAMEGDDQWQLLFDDLASPGNQRREATIKILGAALIHELANGSLKILEKLRLMTDGLGDYPPSVIKTLGDRWEKRFLQRARLTFEAPDYSPANNWQADPSVFLSKEGQSFGREIEAANIVYAKLHPVARASQSSGSSADPFSLASPPLFPRTNPPLWQVFTDFRMAHALPPHLQMEPKTFTLKQIRPDAALLDMVCGGEDVFLLVKQIEDQQENERERKLGVNLGLAQREVTRVWDFNPRLGNLKMSASISVTNRLTKLAWINGRLWAAGNVLISIDPVSLIPSNVYGIPENVEEVTINLVGDGTRLYFSTATHLAEFLPASGEWSFPRLHRLLGGGQVVAGIQGTFLATGRLFAMRDTNGFNPVVPKISGVSLPEENFAGSIASSSLGGVWIGGNFGLMHYSPTNGFSNYQYPSRAMRYIRNFSALMQGCEQARKAYPGYPNLHPFRPLSRFEGGLLDLHSEGDFLWVKTMDGGEESRLHPYLRCLMLMHQPTRQWVGAFSIASGSNPIAFTKDALWVLSSDASAFRLSSFDCRSLYSSPRSSWVSTQPDRAELDRQVASWTLKEQALDAFTGGNYTNVVRLLNELSPLDEDPQAQFMLALAYLSKEVRQPELGLKALETLLLWEPETSQWYPLAQARVDVAKLMILEKARGGDGFLKSKEQDIVARADAVLISPEYVRTLYKDFDLDGNGRLDDEELLAMDIDPETSEPHICASLFLFDLDKSFALEQNEQFLLYGVFRSQAKAIFALYDSNHDGLLSLEEAKNLEQHRPSWVYGFKLVKTFDTVDLNHDGALSIGELAWGLVSKTVEVVTDFVAYVPKIWHKEFLPYDKNRNGNWDAEEIHARMMDLMKENLKRGSVTPTTQANSGR